MPRWTIYSDEPHEGEWFKKLHADLASATEEAITGSVDRNPLLNKVLLYDRPDIILAADDIPVLVLERTIEVPSGHNVGQRFARLAAAAEANVPVVYFGPYKARKHGGQTAGPRYMNLRLFAALDVVAKVNSASVTCINWPVDARSEIVKNASKDNRLREYLDLFFTGFKLNPQNLNTYISESRFEQAQLAERNAFVAGLRRSAVYDKPPASVAIVPGRSAARQFGIDAFQFYDEVVMYSIGMRAIRSDPYTGMAILYKYLYTMINGAQRKLILCMPHIDPQRWQLASATGRRKDIRLFRLAADGIIFSDGTFVPRELL